MANIQLTFTQCKQLIENGADLRDFVDSLNNQPNYINSMGTIDSISELQAIIQAGCASGAYMPAVTYHTALEIMSKYSDDIEGEIVDVYPDGLLFTPEIDSWSGLAVKLVSSAVEVWCYRFADVLDGVNWD